MAPIAAAQTLERTETGLSIEEEFACEPGNEGWKVAAGRIEIPEGETYAVATNARLEIYDVPVLWAPRLTVPVTDERKSGWLFPSIGYSDQNGADISAPYYLNLAPNFDATVTPRVMTERGVLLGEVRHLTANMENTLGGAFLPKDDNYNGDFPSTSSSWLPTDVCRRAPSAPRIALGVSSRGNWVPGLTTRVDCRSRHDDYLRDIGTDLASNGQPEIDRTASVRLRRGGLDIMAWAQDIRILQENQNDVYERMPAIDMAWHERFGSVPMVFGVDFQYADFDRSDSRLAGVDTITGDRLHIVPRFTLPVEWEWGYIEATAAWKYTRYNLGRPRRSTPCSPTRSAESVWCSGTTAASRSSTAAATRCSSRSRTIRRERCRPRASTWDCASSATLYCRNAAAADPRAAPVYRDRTHRNQNDLPIFDTADLTFGSEALFRENRFSGIDRINDANQLTVAVAGSPAPMARTCSRHRGSHLLFRRASGDARRRRRPEQKDDKSGWVSDSVLRLGGGYDAKALWVWNNEDGNITRASCVCAGLVRSTQPLQHRLSHARQKHRPGRSPLLLALPSEHGALAATSMTSRTRKPSRPSPISSTTTAKGRLHRSRLLASDPGPGRRRLGDGVFVEVVMKNLAGFDSGLGSVLEEGIYGFRQQQDLYGYRL